VVPIDFSTVLLLYYWCILGKDSVNKVKISVVTQSLLWSSEVELSPALHQPRFVRAFRRFVCRGPALPLILSPSPNVFA
jgi:hypothetical protein